MEKDAMASNRPSSLSSAAPDPAPLSGAELNDLLRTHKNLAAVRGLSADTCAALYAQAFAALQKKDYGRALYLFSFLVLHAHDCDAHWQGLGHAQAGLGNHAAAAMTLLVAYERAPEAGLALELAKNFTLCGLPNLAQPYAQAAQSLAQEAGDKKLAGQARLLRQRLAEGAP